MRRLELSKRTKCIRAVGISMLLFLHAATTAKIVEAQEILEAIENTATVVVVVEKPDELADFISRMTALDDVRLQAALALLTRSEWAVVEPESVESFQERIHEFTESLREINGLTIVCCGSPDRPESWLAVFEPGRNDTNSLERSIAGIWSSGLELSEQLKDLIGEFPVMLKSVIVKPADRWVIAGLDSALVESFASRLTGSPFPSKRRITEFRRFQMMTREMIENSKSIGWIYTRPELIRSELPFGNDDSVWKAMQPDECLGVGMQIEFPKVSVDQADDQARAILRLHSIVRFTEPAMGYAKIIDAGMAIDEIPPMAFKISDFSTQKMDRKKQLKAIREIDELIPEQNLQTEPKLRRQYTNFPPERFDELFCRNGMSFVARYESVPGRIRAISITEVKDVELTREYVETVVAERNARHSNANIIPQPTSTGQLYGMTKSAFLKSYSDTIDNSSEEQFERTRAANDSWFFNDKWLVEGDRDAVEKEIALLENSETASDVVASESIDFLAEHLVWAGGEKPWSIFVITSLVKRLELERFHEQYSISSHQSLDEDRRDLIDETAFPGTRIVVGSREDARAAASFLIGNALLDRFGSRIVTLHRVPNGIDMSISFYGMPAQKAHK